MLLARSNFDAKGTILHYNVYESQLAGVDQKSVVGKNFFREVAPCTAVKSFYGQFKAGNAERKVATKFRFRFDFQNKAPMEVGIIIQYSPISRTTWVFVHPVDDRGP